jgi:serine/threonine protein kinase
MYSDTKKSYDTVTKPTKADGGGSLFDSSLLQRKLRIQKDRLITWGLDWSDTSAAAETGDIDESLEREGLADVVGSIMTSIKEMLDEAELMQCPDVGAFCKEKVSERPSPADLLHDLTTSIDTLYDLSRSRRALRQTPGPDTRRLQYFPDLEKPSKDPYAYSPVPRDVSSRVETSLLIDSSSVIIPGDNNQPPSYESTLATPATPIPLSVASSPPKIDHSRTVGYLRLSRTSSGPWSKDGSQGTIPVLIEYAPFDPIYATTMIFPSLSRLESLAESLHQSGDLPRSASFRVLNLLGYFEDPQGARYGLVYELPHTIYRGPSTFMDNTSLESLKPVSLLSILEVGITPGPSPTTTAIPNLEDRFRLAFNLANTVLLLHAKGTKHRDIKSANVILFPTGANEPVQPPGERRKADLRNPYLASFDVFSEYDFANAHDSHVSNIYRHPNDPLISRADANKGGTSSFDLYGLGMVLLEIGLWMPLKSFWKMKYTPGIFKSRIENIYVKKLASKCGSFYMKAVEFCLMAPDSERLGNTQGATPEMAYYWNVVKRLERCCVFDGPDPAMAGSRGSSSLHSGVPYNRAAPGVGSTAAFRPPAPHRTESNPLDPLEVLSPDYPPTTPHGANLGGHPVARLNTSIAPAAEAGPAETARRPPVADPAPRPRLRVHPVNASPALLDDWHRNILPRIERLLEKTLADSPETVTVDLIGVGENQSTARPTIFVTCANVQKVKAVLTRRFKYDKSKFDLKVRKGKVRRSAARRRRPRANLPGHSSLNRGDPDNMPAKNPFYQNRPLSGASIGAYLDEKHLPPATFGGVVLVDKKPLAMTVHHLLDAPSEEEDSDFDDEGNYRSNARWLSSYQLPTAAQGAPGDYPYGMQDYTLEISDDEEDMDMDMYSASEFDYDSDLPSEEGEDQETDDDLSSTEWGDLPGFDKDERPDIIITQPAIDDVDEDFFPNEEDKDEEHLSSHSLGNVHASSGVRRWQKDGIKHEIDWALLNINEDRLQPYNLIQGGKRFCPQHKPDFIPKLVPPINRHNAFAPEEDLYPTRVAKTEDLSQLKVHCLGRTSGLQGGVISAAMSSLKIYGRRTYSRSWHIVGRFGGKSIPIHCLDSRNCN